MIYYIADLHFGHSNCIKFDNRPFKDVEEMDRILIENWNSRVQEKDDVYIVGDFCYRSKNSPEWYLKRLKGKKHLILGNHDHFLKEKEDIEKYFEEIENLKMIKDGENEIVLCHYPMVSWNKSHHGSYHIYAHIHTNGGMPFEVMRKIERAYNAGCMINNYMPVTFKELEINNKNYIENYVPKEICIENEENND